MFNLTSELEGDVVAANSASIYGGGDMGILLGVCE